MANNDVLHDLFPLVRVYNDGRIERFVGNDVVPASVDPATGVQSKDIVVSAENDLCARLYIPKSADLIRKLPLLIYFHGGGFVVESAFSPAYHTHMNNLVAEANIVALSVNYRLAPEHPLPVAYEDSWAAVKWVGSHLYGSGSDPWLKDYADLGRMFFAGDSAGANITHNLAIRVGSESESGELLELEGVILVHPYFIRNKEEQATKEPERTDMMTGAWFTEKLWALVKPGSGSDDPLINPDADPKLSSLGSKRVLILVAEKDGLRDVNWYYKELLEKSGWGGKVEALEAKGEGHVFHLFNPTCENAVALLKSIASFINEEKTTV